MVPGTVKLLHQKNKKEIYGDQEGCIKIVLSFHILRTHCRIKCACLFCVFVQGSGGDVQASAKAVAEAAAKVSCDKKVSFVLLSQPNYAHLQN